MNQEHMEQLLDLLKNALESGHHYVLCVEYNTTSILPRRQTNFQKIEGVGSLLNQQMQRQTNIDNEADVAKLLEKFARQSKEVA